MSNTSNNNTCHCKESWPERCKRLGIERAEGRTWSPSDPDLDAVLKDYERVVPFPVGITKNAAASQVLHVRIGATPERPWEGSSPLARSQATRDALKEIEKSLRLEHSGPHGALLPTPAPEDATLKDALLKLAGKLLLVEQSELGLSGEGQAARTMWVPKRLGPMPNESTLTTREQLSRSLLTACGLPPAMVSPSTANSAREGLRQFLWLTVNPIVALISEELERLGLDPKN